MMLLEAHVPDRAHAPVPGAAELAQELRPATREGAKAVRERRVPRWDWVRALLAGRDAPAPGVLRGAAEQV
ncbi:FUSC family protein, partial [Streptomyces sp. NPDC056387]